MKPLRHVPALDGIRGVAILLVVGFHYWREPIGGFIGVDLFFVLSGFLITTLLLEEKAAKGRVSLRGFYERRARRLLPALFMLVVIVGPGGQLWPAVAGALYISNIANAVQTIHGPLAHLWSLGEEEQFYLLWPLVLLLGLAAWRRSVLFLALAAAVVAAARAVLVEGGVSVHALYMLPVSHADPLLVGCAVAFLRARGITLPSRLAPVALLSLVGVTFLLHGGAQGERSLTWGIPVASVLSACAVLSAVSGPQRLVASRPLVWLGVISYSLYLWHPLILELARNPLAALPIALLVAWLSYRFVEQPFRCRRASVDRPDAGHIQEMEVAVPAVGSVLGNLETGADLVR